MQKSFEEFVFLMEKLGYEVKIGAHISVKAEGMRRSRRLDTLDEEFSVQKCCFQYKYTRYQQDLVRMKELQEEYLFLNREGINGWEDVFRAKQTAELKERRKEAKREYATINLCISESTFAHMEISLDVDVENLYMVDVPEFEGNKISYEASGAYNEVEADKTSESYEDSVSYDEAEFCEPELADGAEVLHESELVETELVEVTCELVNASTEIVDEEYADSQIYYVPDMTKERYEILTDKEKVEWLGIAECSVQDAIQRFITKLDSIGVVYRYSDDMLDEFMRLESVAAQMKREPKETEKEQDTKMEERSINLRTR